MYVAGSRNEKRGTEAELSYGPLLHRTATYSWSRLGIPDGDGPHYGSDVDAALLTGNRLVLIDIKCWHPDHYYWSFGSNLYRDLTKLEPMSRNIELAVSRYQDLLPEVDVSAMVVFVSGRTGRDPRLIKVRWPGGIRSYRLHAGLRELRRRLGPVGSEPSSPEVVQTVSDLQLSRKHTDHREPPA